MRARRVQDSKIVRHQAVRKPDEVCLRCFNSQQQLRFPFLVYCVHRGVLALIHSTTEFSTFDCAPAQLTSLLARLGGLRAAKPQRTSLAARADGR
jgi:hypothetical protein